jgi:hypothetical protein
LEFAVDDLGWVATRTDVHNVVSILERCAAMGIDLASRRGLQFATAKTEAAMFTFGWGHRKYLRPTMAARIGVTHGSI